MANEKCKHKWVDMEDGTNDQFCVRCSLKQMQNVMPLPSLNAEEGMKIGGLMAGGLAQGMAIPVQHNPPLMNIARALHEEQMKYLSSGGVVR